jgi:hypothetical protein
MHEMTDDLIQDGPPEDRGEVAARLDHPRGPEWAVAVTDRARVWETVHGALTGPPSYYWRLIGLIVVLAGVYQLLRG